MEIITVALKVVLAFLMTAVGANAGAWPREKGAVFLSFQGIVQADFENPIQQIGTMSTIYGEYGLTNRLTLGFDGVVDQDLTYSGLIFLRLPIQLRSKKSKVSYQFGAGYDVLQGAKIQAGLSWGRGFETAFGPGWMSIDAAAQIFANSGEQAFKSDATFGLNRGPRNKIIFQIQSGGGTDTSPYIKFAPSFVRKFGESRHIEIGFEVGVLNTRTVGLKLGNWLEF